MKRISVAYIIDNQKNILALKRSEIKKTYPGKWHVLSGTVEDEENPTNCLTREICEELGSTFQTTTLAETHYEDTEWSTYIFTLLYTDGDITLNLENSEYTWVPFERFIQLDLIPSIFEDLKHLDTVHLTTE
jgi:8-oxo-dGTP pyrophosphatase MutT (NUDIX family)